MWPAIKGQRKVFISVVVVGKPPVHLKAGQAAPAEGLIILKMATLTQHTTVRGMTFMQLLPPAEAPSRSWLSWSRASGNLLWETALWGCLPVPEV